MSDPISLERRFALWVGALLLHRGHVVALPNGKPELHVLTRKAPKRIWLSVRDTPVEHTGRIVVGTVAELEEMTPDAVVILCEQAPQLEAIVVVPVQSTKESWLNEGRHYTIPADKIADFDKLDQWLTKLGRPA